MTPLKTNPTKTVLTIVVGFILVFFITQWKWSLTLALLVGATGLLSSYMAIKIDWLWMKLTQVLSLIMPNLILGAVFYLFLFPIAILSRWFGKKDPLILKNRLSSTFTESNKKFDKGSFEHPW